MPARGSVKGALKRRAAWWAVGSLGSFFGLGGVLILVVILGITVIVGGGLSSGSQGGSASGACGVAAPQPAAATTSSSSSPLASAGTSGKEVPLPQPGPYSGDPSEQAKPGTAAGPIPENMLAIYQDAAEHYGIPWTLLAAIGWEEMKHNVVRGESSAGAQGPMQFMPATWARYGVDGDGDGKADPYNITDSIYAAANYLVASGVATGDEASVKKAIFAYNHADWYVNDILVWAQQYGAGHVVGSAVEPGEACPAANAASSGGSSGGWILPVAHASYTSCFCERWGTMHSGIDLAAPQGTPILAAADGVVVEAGPASGFGLWVVIQHPQANNYYTVYGHMYVMNVSAGQQVKAGQQIAEVGSNGQSTGPHLHLEVQTGPAVTQGKIDPAPFLTEHGVTLPPYQG